ncbi:MAG: hypothetical protein ACFE85_16755, partial [Candidatus Hodarchaeota archaeon]
IIIIFYANDSVGNVGSATVTVYKDIIGPDISITEPDSYEVFGINPPSCTIAFSDINGVEERWYQLTNGTFTTDFQEWSGSIDADDWSLMPNGTLTILFYANDSFGNVGSVNVTIYKDIVAPSIIIYEPQDYELFGIIPPDINISIYDPNLESVWYQLDNGTISTSFIEWIGYADQAVWDTMGNGTVIIRFIAYDSVNNLASSSVTVRKNIYDPMVVILDPDDYDIFGITPPNITLFIQGADIDRIWYQLTNNSITTENYTWEGYIDNNLWELFGDGSITIRFYLNDTLGNLGLDFIILIKDVTLPTILLYSPSPYELFGSNPPDISIDFYDLNSINKTWYQLQNYMTTLPTRDWTGSIDLNDWDAMLNGTVTILFYANDSVGNLATTNITVYKDIVEPFITIYDLQDGDLYSFQPPLINFYITEPNGISSISYQLDNGTFSTSRLEWTGSIEQGIWDQFGNGTLIIYIYAIDTLGNEGSISVIVKKDLLSPEIEIISPNINQEVGRDPPFFEVNITDGNLDACWYNILGTNMNITFTGIYGKIDESLWESVWNNSSENEIITIRFYANDTVGNVNYKDIEVLKTIYGDERPLTLPFNLIDLIPLSFIAGVTILTSIFIKKSRYYHTNSIKSQQIINKILILVVLLVILISVSILLF